MIQEIKILTIAFSIAFSFQQVVYIQKKPFNCLMCLTGWLSPIVALAYGYGAYSILFIPVGLLFGALLDNFMRRWL